MVDNVVTEDCLKELLTDINNQDQVNEKMLEFVSIISHELQPSLMNIKGFTKLLENNIQKDSKNIEISNFIKGIYVSCERINLLFTSLLCSVMITNNIGHSRLVSLNEIILNVLENLTLLIKETKAKILFDRDYLILGNQMQLELVFQNLIQNALKYRGKEKPVIKIVAEEEDKHWKIYVTDNGLGIKTDSREKIFEPFFQILGPTRKKGFGLGLSICKRIIEQHGGKIWVESNFQNGSKFIFTLPKP